MKNLGKIHLYTGLFFAPLLLYLALSGAWMSFNLHRSLKDGSYKAPVILQEISEVHLNQRYGFFDEKTNKPKETSLALQWMFVFAGLGLSLLAMLGVILGFWYLKNKLLPITLLTVGMLLPVVFLLIAH